MFKSVFVNIFYLAEKNFANDCTKKCSVVVTFSKPMRNLSVPV